MEDHSNLSLGLKHILLAPNGGSCSTYPLGHIAVQGTGVF